MKSQMPYLGAQKSRLTQVVRRMTRAAKLDREQRLASPPTWDQAEFREQRYAALAVLRAGPLEPGDEPCCAT